ncbi:Gryzun, putative trafficking through golgi-domain-containing protein [Lophiotrema nucula]|uniref:Gryzun, putative trafficking through golgi-domain-containing protein n=1 Tax=Lophiotrema nucula TaxID=690887 RepID=A0A6A5ZQ17_9PLEO|nr:Gryzun, putative trafficking through golgi-domain-containing protein [Lophiotrema nucula]
MDAYPPEFVQHNLPFIVLSGLEDKSGLEPIPAIQDVLPGRAITTINSDVPSIAGKDARQLLREFLSLDGSGAPWNARGGAGRANLLGFRFRAVGRRFQLPPRKADPPASTGISPPSSPTTTSPPSWTLHSPISPLTPGSPIFPDGVIAPTWIAKHQQYVPSVFISFFEFSSDPNTDSLRDNQLKTEINRIKGQIQKSEYRTKYAVVLMGDESVLDAQDVEERLATIRRATGLDLKTSLFTLPPNQSPAELRSFAVSVLSTLQPVSVEYYRDLTKHSRRKKGRGTVPPPTAPPTRGTSQTLSHPGWNVRYDFKLGVFAEFRQEMDAAQRHYNFALEALFGSEGIFETTASWLPRWDDIRLLADAIALRQVRCHLWNAMPTAAAQAWLKYKLRLNSLLDRRGKGTSNYGWAAWESRWAQIMAQLIQRAELQVFSIKHPISQDDPLINGTNEFFSPPEKHIPVGERLSPWELLHHAGYWYKLSADNAKRRYILAKEIPEEDRTPPGMSPAAKVSNRNQIYDHYLVPEPHLENPLPDQPGGFEHWKDIYEKLKAAIAEFDSRGQQRKVEQLQLEASRTLLHVKRFDEAFKVLRPLWESMYWRREGWWTLASEVLWGLHECALRVQDAETYVATEWELLSQAFVGKSRYRHDLMGSLASFPQGDAAAHKPSIFLDNKDFVSSVFATLTFSEAEGHVGEPLQSQVALSSTARAGSASVTLSTLTFQYNGSLSEIHLSHKPDEAASDQSTLSDCVLEETTQSPQKPRWLASVDMTIHPGQTKVFNFPIIFREAGDLTAVATRFEINADRFDLVCSSTDVESEELSTWWLQAGTKLKSRKLNKNTSSTIKVLPKPPKMDIRLPDLRSFYYTDEPVSLDIEITNKEDEDTESVVEVRLLGRSKDTLGYSWAGHDAASPSKEIPPSLDGSDLDLPGHVVGILAQGAQRTEKIKFIAPSEPSDYALEVKVLYHLASDRDIPISKTLIAELIFNGPFEANFEFTPRLHPDPWPSYFNLPEAETDNTDPESTAAFGIAQKWHLQSKVASFAEEALIVKDMTLETHSIHGGAALAVSKEFDPEDTTMTPQDLAERSFTLDTRKIDLEDRRPTALDLSLNITWQRPGNVNNNNNPSVTTSLPIPRIQIPAPEPRVLCTALPSSTVPDLFHFDYTLENPTMHFLTFELNMEASEEFGFSGPKLRGLHLLPLSRQTVRYNILPLVRGKWVSPLLRVTDRYFNKNLKVQGTGGLRGGKGVGVWVGGEE